MKKNYLAPILQVSAILLVGFGFIYFASKTAPIRPQIITIETPIQCPNNGLTAEQVEIIIRQEFVDALRFNYVFDGALGEPTLVPLLKEIIK